MAKSPKGSKLKHAQDWLEQEHLPYRLKNKALEISGFVPRDDEESLRKSLLYGGGLYTRVVVSFSDAYEAYCEAHSRSSRGGRSTFMKACRRVADRDGSKWAVDWYSGGAKRGGQERCLRYLGAVRATAGMRQAKKRIQEQTQREVERMRAAIKRLCAEKDLTAHVEQDLAEAGAGCLYFSSPAGARELADLLERAVRHR